MLAGHREAASVAARAPHPHLLLIPASHSLPRSAIFACLTQRVTVLIRLGAPTQQCTLLLGTPAHPAPLPSPPQYPGSAGTPSLLPSMAPLQVPGAKQELWRIIPSPHRSGTWNSTSNGSKVSLPRGATHSESSGPSGICHHPHKGWGTGGFQMVIEIQHQTCRASLGDTSLGGSF